MFSANTMFSNVIWVSPVQVNEQTNVMFVCSFGAKGP